MLNMNLYLTFYLFLIICLMYSFLFKHLLMTMISLEFLMVMVFFNLYMIIMIFKISFYMIFVFLTMTVCEGALGVTLIIMIVRFYGNDYTNSMVMLKW